MEFASLSLKEWTFLNPCLKAEETVVASIHLVDIEGKEEPTLLVLCSGTKVLSDDVISSTEYGNLVRDLHAEVLCRRGLMRILINDILSKGKRLILEDYNGDDHYLPSLKKGFYLHMWISKGPCGEYGLQSLGGGGGGSGGCPPCKKLSDEPPSKRQKGLLKGNILPEVSSIFRTKPGRIDSPQAHSLSCTNKIQLWQQIGWQGSLLGRLMQKITIKYLEIGDGYVKDVNPFANIIIIPSKINYSLHIKPSPITTVWWKGILKQERIVDGRLFGSNRPRIGTPLNPRCQSSLSSSSFYKILSLKDAYFDEKKKNIQYQKEKSLSHPPNRPHHNEEMRIFRNLLNK